jgi:hypothetical protein
MFDPNLAPEGFIYSETPEEYRHSYIHDESNGSAAADSDPRDEPSGSAAANLLPSTQPIPLPSTQPIPQPTPQPTLSVLPRHLQNPVTFTQNASAMPKMTKQMSSTWMEAYKDWTRLSPSLSSSLSKKVKSDTIHKQVFYLAFWDKVHPFWTFLYLIWRLKK